MTSSSRGGENGPAPKGSRRKPSGKKKQKGKNSSNPQNSKNRGGRQSQKQDQNRPSPVPSSSLPAPPQPSFTSTESLHHQASYLHTQDPIPSASPANTTSMYQFGGDSYRPGGAPSHRDRTDHRQPESRHQFSFRADTSARFPERNTPSERRDRRRQPDRNQPDRRRPNNNGNGNFRRDNPDRRSQQNHRPYVRPPPTYDRAIIQALRVGGRERTPDQLEGMQVVAPRFKNVDELSDEDFSSAMDMSQSSEEETNGDGPPKKRVKVDTQASESKPKWSNPDPYFVQLPVDEPNAKKRDVVELIRKAKVDGAASAKTANAISENVDFVAFDFSDDDEPELVIPQGPAPPRGPRNAAPARNDSWQVRQNERMGDLPTGPAGHRLPVKPIPYQLPEGHDARLPYNSQPDPRAAGLPPRPPPPREPQYGRQDSYRPPPPPPPLPVAPNVGRSKESQKRKRGAQAINGNITPEWVASSAAISTPWVDVDHSGTENMGFWLHKEICDFYAWVKPRPFEHQMRQDLVDRISDVLSRTLDGKLYCFGSFAAGLYLPTADMDLVWVSDSFEKTGVARYGSRNNPGDLLFGVRRKLVRAGICLFEDTTVIAKARVPIIKLVDIETGLNVDISFENLTGVVANRTFQEWKIKYPAMPKLVCVIKQFLAMRNMNEVFLGGLGGFSITCMVISLFENHPPIQSGTMDPEHHLGQLLLEFLDFYGNKLNMDGLEIRFEPPGYYPKQPQYYKDGRPKETNKWAIIDPNDPANDVSAGSTLAPLIKQTFSRAFSTLQQYMALVSSSKIQSRQGKSLLGQVIGGDYKSFVEQRNHLLSLHQTKIPTR